jgi:uncharacterized membrane protein YebE (DUF533 family)
MFDTKQLLEGFLGGNASGNTGRWSDSRSGAPRSGAPLSGVGGMGSLQDMLGGLLGGSIGSMGSGTGGSFGGARPPLGGGIGGAAAGGLLGSLLGGRRRSGGGGLLRMGGLAVLGMLAHRAYNQWQSQAQGRTQTADAPPSQSDLPPDAPPTAPGPWSGAAQQGGAGAPAAIPHETEFAREDAPAADGHPFGLSLIRAMISAAKSDGHLDQNERDRIFEEVERLGLDAEAKGFVFQAMDAPADPGIVAGMARTEAQKAEIYMASRLVAEPDTAAERAYLDALAHRLGLASGLRASLDAQAAEASRLAAQAGLSGQHGQSGQL